MRLCKFAPETVSKAFGTGMGGGIKWRDIEIVNDKRNP